MQYIEVLIPRDLCFYITYKPQELVNNHYDWTTGLTFDLKFIPKSQNCEGKVCVCREEREWRKLRIGCFIVARLISNNLSSLLS